MPWGVMFSRRRCGCCWLQYFTLSYAWYFFVTWFPTYLNEVHKYDLKVQGALMAGLPLFFGGFGSLFAGYITPALTRMTGSVRTTRSILGFSGQALAGCCLILATFIQQPILAVAVDRDGQLLQRHDDAGLVDRPAWTSAASSPARSRAR